MLKYHHSTTVNFWIFSCTLVYQFSKGSFWKEKEAHFSQRGVTRTLGGPLTTPLSQSRLLLDDRYFAPSVGHNLVSVWAWKCKKGWMPSHLALTLSNHICCLGMVAAATPTKLPNKTSSKQPRLLLLKIWKYTWSWWNHLYSQLSLKGHLSKTSWWYIVGPLFCWLIATLSISPNSVEGLGESWIYISSSDRLDFRHLPDPIFDPPRREVLRWVQTHFPKQRLVIKPTVLFTGNPPLSPLEGLFILSPFEGGGGLNRDRRRVFVRGGLMSFRKGDGVLHKN